MVSSDNFYAVNKLRLRDFLWKKKQQYLHLFFLYLLFCSKPIYTFSGKHFLWNLFSLWSDRFLHHGKGSSCLLLSNVRDSRTCQFADLYYKSSKLLFLYICFNNEIYAILVLENEIYTIEILALRYIPHIAGQAY